MNFRFDVNITEEDYYNFNKFWMIRSHYGKKQMLALRAFLLVLFAVLIAVNFKDGNFSFESIVVSAFWFVLIIVSQILLAPMCGVFLKSHLKSLKKKGKMAYSPNSVIEFHDDFFVEITPENKTEQKYSAVERICVVDNKMIYIHVNSIMAYILPMAVFESKERHDTFFEFIKTKCPTVEVY